MTNRDMYAISSVNTMGQGDFVTVFGEIYEASPWVAESAWEHRPFADLAMLDRVMAEVVRSAESAKQLALVCAHPELGAGGTLSANSRGEQQAAGLEATASTDAQELSRLNEDYVAKFDFPFIVAVAGLDVTAIIASLRNRVQNNRAAEIDESLAQIYKIAGFRLAALVVDDAALTVSV